jgi:hypothetical protein
MNLDNRRNNEIRRYNIVNNNVRALAVILLTNALLQNNVNEVLQTFHTSQHIKYQL